MPAAVQMATSEFYRSLQLFCTWKGVVYRVTGASRLGDIYLQPDHDRDRGYELRVFINAVKDLRAEP